MTGATIWSDNGRGDKNVSVDLECQPAFADSISSRHRLVAIGEAYAWIASSVPEDCIEEYALYFPTQLRIKRACRVYATLEVSMYKEGAEMDGFDYQAGLTITDQKESHR